MNLKATTKIHIHKTIGNFKLKWLGTFFVFFVAALLGSEILWHLMVPKPEGILLTYHDYWKDADPSLIKGSHAGLFSMFSTNPMPLMMPLALLLRLPSLWFGNLTGFCQLSGDVPQIVIQNRYMVGCISTMTIAGVVAALSWLPKQWNYKDLSRGIILIAFLILNPLTQQAITWGHPEEVLMAGFIIAAVLNHYRERELLSIASLAAAVATKQPAFLMVPLFFFGWSPQKRWKNFVWFLGFATIFILPFVAADFWVFIQSNTGLMNTSVNFTDHAFDFSTAINNPAVAIWERPVLFVVVIILPWLATKRNNSSQLTTIQIFYLLPLLLLLRCILDPFNIDYYALPAVAACAVLEMYLWSEMRHPLQRFIKRTWLWFLQLPIISVMLAFYIEELTGGALYDLAGTYLDRLVLDLFYFLMMSILVIGLILVTFELVPNFNRKRKIFYTSVVGLVLILIGAVILHGPK